jgi:pyruvate kinase
MDVARLNLSHGTTEEHRTIISNIRQAEHESGKTVAILLDLPGPKMRIGDLPVGPVILKRGKEVRLCPAADTTIPGCIPVECRDLHCRVRKGSRILLDDGFMQLKVTGLSGEVIVCRVVSGGTLSSRKGLSITGEQGYGGALGEDDFAGIRFGTESGIDTFSISFVGSEVDIKQARDFAATRGKNIRVIAKIERGEALDNLPAIIDAADGVMIARGDLGVQVPLEDVPAIQKKIIRMAMIRGKPVITATQMMESMKDHNRPTRAEVTDVANAIFDGTDALMLSAETSVGLYPVETVSMMAKIARAAEKARYNVGKLPAIHDDLVLGRGKKKMNVGDVISLNVMDAIRSLPIRYILTPTRSGSTPRRISRFRPDIWILSFSRSDSAQKFLSFSYGVFPVMLEGQGSISHDEILSFLREKDLAHEGDLIILTEGTSGKKAGTDSLRIIHIE